MNKKLFSSSFSNVTLLGLKFCIAFIMTPVIVRSLGNHDYGIWEIGTSILGYMGLLQFGLPPAIVRYVARYTALEDKESLNRLYSTALCILAIIGVICFTVIVGFALLVPDILAEEGKNPLKYTYYFIIMAFQALVVFSGTLFQSFHEGFQRYYITNGITAFNSVTGAVIMYFLLTNGYGLIGLAAGNTIGMGLKFLTFHRLLRIERFGGFRFRSRDVSKRSARSLFSFGVKSFILGVSGRVAASAAPIIIGSFLSPAMVPFFSIPAGLLRRISNTVQAVTLGFMPYLSELHARKDTDRSLQIFFDASRFIVSFVCCSFLGVFFLGLPFISCWIGPSYAEKGKNVLFLLALYFLWPMLNPLQGRVLTSMGRQGKLAKVRAWEVLVNLGLSLAMVRPLGLEGVALAAVISRTLFEPVVFWVVSRNLNVTVWRYPREVLLSLLAPLAIGGAVYYLLLQALAPTTYTAILMIGAIGSAAYLAAFFLTSVSRTERQRLSDFVKKIFAPKLRFNSR